MPDVTAGRIRGRHGRRDGGERDFSKRDVVLGAGMKGKKEICRSIIHFAKQQTAGETGEESRIQKKISGCHSI